MSLANLTTDRPSYDRGDRAMLEERAPRAAAFASLILDTCAPFLPVDEHELQVLDVGCGYGHTALEIAKRCARVVGIEPSAPLHEQAAQLGDSSGIANVEFRQESIYDLVEVERYDLVVLDNVLEHLADQPSALRRISECLKPRGVAFILVPNKLWPIEVHYRLPFLGYLPLKAANMYLRLSGRGSDFAEASHAPTYFSIRRLFRARPELSYQYVLPSNVALATHGWSASYAFGVAAIRRFPRFWALSKVFLIIAVKT